MKISLIMCTRNRPLILLRFVKSLFAQTKQVDEFIIIDSSDIPLNQTASFDEIEKMFPTLIYKHTQPGLTFQRNAGVSIVSGDIVLENEYIEIVSNVFVSNDQFVGGMGQIPVKPYNRKQKIEELFCKFFMLPHKHGNGKFYSSGFAKMPHGTEGFFQVDVLSGGIAAYKVDILKKYKFDEYFTGYGYMEDAEYSRWISLENKLFYISKAICHHLHVQGGRGNSFELGKMIARNYTYVFKKHFSKIGMTNKISRLWAINGLILYGIFFNRNIDQVKGYISGFLNPRV